MLWETIKLAVQSIRRNVLRSVLTALGIVIGVGSVITLVTIGRGTTARVQGEMERLGVNLLVLRPGQHRRGPGAARTEARQFDDDDVTALRAHLRSVQAVAPVAARQGTVVSGNDNWATSLVGTDNAYFVTQGWTVAEGRTFTAGELRGGRGVCVLGESVREELFGKANPVGERVRLGKIPCEVVGVLTARGQAGWGGDRDDTVLVPLETFQRRIAGSTDIRTIYVSAQEGADTRRVQRDIEAILRERRRIGPDDEDDFSIHDMKDLVQAMTGTTTALTQLLGAVAAVSLLVGGIGIMNIMLVSVTERTREVGIRLAVGALERQVLVQFLVEAVVLSLLGGLVGIAFGLGLALAASRSLALPFVFDLQIVLVAFAFSALVGILFGYFPARRAARLDPIVALRHE